MAVTLVHVLVFGHISKHTRVLYVRAAMRDVLYKMVTYYHLWTESERRGRVRDTDKEKKRQKKKKKDRQRRGDTQRKRGSER